VSVRGEHREPTHGEIPTRRAPGIIILRLDDQSGPAVTAAVLELVDGHGLANLAGAITVVQGGLLRIRR